MVLYLWFKDWKGGDIMACPSGTTRVGACESYVCTDGCGIWGINYRHEFDRCMDKNGKTTCEWINSVYLGCDCWGPG